MQPLERQWTILRILAARRFGATVRELSEEFAVSQKTIRRDLTVMSDLGFPISAKDGRHGRNHWTASWEQDTPPLTFDVSEILALYLGRTLLEPLAGTVVWDAAQSAFRRIRAALNESALEYLDKLGTLIHRTSFHDSGPIEAPVWTGIESAGVRFPRLKDRGPIEAHTSRRTPGWMR